MPLMLTDNPLVESILLAAGLPDAEISARVADIAPDIVAEAMLAEVACGRPGGRPKLPGADAQRRPRR
jgi:hypothetical protein